MCYTESSFWFEKYTAFRLGNLATCVLSETINNTDRLFLFLGVNILLQKSYKKNN